jgi:hypothetical protein
VREGQGKRFRRRRESGRGERKRGREGWRERGSKSERVRPGSEIDCEREGWE